MLYYNQINVSEGIGINKNKDSHKCRVCCYKLY